MVVDFLAKQEVGYEQDANGDLAFTYESVPMRVEIEWTKHLDTELSIFVDREKTPALMQCGAYLTIQGHLAEPAFPEMLVSVIESVCADGRQLAQLTDDGHRHVTHLLESCEIPFFTDPDGLFVLEFEDEPLTIEVMRNPGFTFFSVRSAWKGDYLLRGNAKRTLPIDVDADEFSQVLSGLVGDASEGRWMPPRS